MNLFVFQLQNIINSQQNEVRISYLAYLVWRGAIHNIQYEVMLEG